MNNLAPPTQPDLTNCDREPIHIPGTILPHGAMLVVDPHRLVIEQAAGDTLGLLGAEIEKLLGRPLSALFSGPQVSRLSELTKASSLRKSRHFLDPFFRVVPGRPVDASVHRSDDALVIEFEAADLDDPRASDPLASVQEMFDGLNDAATITALCQVAAERVRTVTGYDRVMVYRFMPDDSGWVIAEQKRADLAPFLDLHYPAADIPKQARALYLRSWIRLITQVDYTPAPLIPAINPRSGRPLDMSHATLRDVSPIHREYLRNMGVDASMSISIVHQGRLWGLIACHHCSPKRLPRHLRAVCELFGSMFSLQLEARQREAQYEARLDSRHALDGMMRALAGEEDYAEGLIRQAQHLLEYIPSGGIAMGVRQPFGGIAIKVDNGTALTGETPSEEQIAALTDWLSATMPEGNGIFVTDRLGEIWPPARAFAAIGAGLLAVSVSREPRDFILWFRPELVRTVQWGGDPNKPVGSSANGDRLTPRKSFEIWTETVVGRSMPWSETDNDAAFDLRVSLLEIVLRRIDAAGHERLRAWEHEKLLMAELDHRVKNTLANIQALVSQSSRTATSLTDFTEGLAHRIQAMSRTHSLLTESRWEGVSIGSLVSGELAAHGNSRAGIVISGPSVLLTPRATLSLSLALHELSTNAAKYGALSGTSGQVAVRWSIRDGDGVQLTWVESHGPPVAPPKRRGFGSTLIERALEMETGGSSELRFLPSGVECHITLPADTIVRLENVDEAPASIDPAVAGPVRVGHRRILVVEDSSLVLIQLEQVINDLGWSVVGPATRISEALAMAAHETFDAALLDVNLDGTMSWEVAGLLLKRGIPFAFTTGYDGALVLPSHLADSIVINKPFDLSTMERRLWALVAETFAD